MNFFFYGIGFRGFKAKDLEPRNYCHDSESKAHIKV